VSGFGKTAVFILLALILFFGVIEIVLRLMDLDFYKTPVDVLEFVSDNPTPAEEAELAGKLFGLISDRDIFWKLKPSFKLTTASLVEKNGVPVYAKEDFRTNSYGFRSPSLSALKKKGVFRIVCLGDSGTFGSGVPQNATFPMQLETMLNKSFPFKKFEVVNSGVPGYSSFQGLLLFRKVIVNLAPDLVIISFGANDQTKVSISDRELYNKRHSFPGNLYWGLKKSDLLSLLFYSMSFYGKDKQSSIVKKTKQRVSSDEFRENMGNIIELAHNNSMDVIVLERNLYWPLKESIEKDIARNKGIVFVPLQSVLQKELDSLLNGEKYISEKKYYDKYFGSSINEKSYLYILINYGHANALGYRIIANELFKAIKTTKKFNRYITNTSTPRDGK